MSIVHNIVRTPVILITGGSKGIGLACAKKFYEDGAQVIISARNQENIDRALEQLPGASGFAADLSEEMDAAFLVERIEREIGPIEVLVNSAGAARRTSPEDLTPALWRAAMDAKYFTTINILDPVVKLMASRKKGVIINIIGAGGKVANPIHLAGGAANAALMLATAGLGSAYANSGVRIIGVSPGSTETDRVNEGLAAEARHSGISIEEAKTQLIKNIPIGRMAQPEDIAELVVFLASNKASYITGINITMDGGQTPVVI
ncbi:SDR family oxidoreductase [Dyadobacter psychrophilus]|uniref:NAD(P)-dependent dehydrogenase, short-chain alcohol dehydrogenase family n=1 Tax=Dyadobacter psychrophilus TaxID=651661 RepID=A0A1T5HIY1_9BACT|nr:SDR family oxidoreductase [Dyadobacter psychrophilus]SKC20624.1 NAD(P)-dependent dehydrogenase, short-chain alcohol dehydrogenase family [Dyadobacter psychrophilus]